MEDFQGVNHHVPFASFPDQADLGDVIKRKNCFPIKYMIELLCNQVI